LIVSTFPPPGGRRTIELAHSAAKAVRGLVHDIHFLIDPGRAQELQQVSNISLAHADVAAPVEIRPASRVPAKVLPLLSRRIKATHFHDAQRPTMVGGGCFKWHMYPRMEGFLALIGSTNNFVSLAIHYYRFTISQSLKQHVVIYVMLNGLIDSGRLGMIRFVVWSYIVWDHA